MASQQNLDLAYLKCAFAIAELSRAKRKKVGAILVAENGGIIGEGYNGTPVNFDNNCEEVVYRIETKYPTGDEHYFTEPLSFWTPLPNGDYRSPRGYIYKRELRTLPHVLHAESNVISKIAKSTNSSAGSTLYITYSPCFECSKLIIQAGIKRVVYAEKYRLTDGIDLLKKAGIVVDDLSLYQDNNSDRELFPQNEGYANPLDDKFHMV